MSAKLAGFAVDFPDDLRVWDMEATRPDTASFPVPELVLMALRNVMCFRWSGQGEKVRWSVYCSVAGEPVAFELRKFGFTILRRKGSTLDLRRVEGQLKAAIKVLEDVLEPFVEAQINEGRVTIGNRFAEFDARYRFFRDLADQAYARVSNPPAELASGEGEPQLFRGLDRRIRAEREGFFHATAMVDAYFSRLEHHLLLLRAFTGKPLAEGELRELLSATWDDKLKAILDFSRDRGLQHVLAHLRRIKERIRNPFAHGGVENDRGSLFFHMPSVGAIPANFSRFKDSVRFNFIPIEADDHQGACATFDELDSLLEAGPLTGPHRLLDAGIDPAFDPETLVGYAKAIAGGPQVLEEFIRAWDEAWTRNANMDY